ncbi:MAG: DUF4401 domain-containing protein [Aeromonas sp.]
MGDLRLWQILQQAKLVTGGEPQDNQPHWSSRFLLGLVGWLAALCLLFFLFMTFKQLTNHANNALMLGTGLFVLAYCIHRSLHNDLWDQLVFALILAADGWLLYGLLDQVDLHHALLWFGLSLLALTIARLFDHRLIQLFHSAGAALLLTLALACSGLQLLALPLVMIAITLCWLASDDDPIRHQVYHGITLGLALSLLVLGRLHYPLWDGGSSVLDQFGLSCLPLWLNPLLCAAVLLAVMVRLKLPLLFGLPLVLISAIIPGVGAGVLILILGFYAASFALMSLSGLLLVSYGAFYYYDLGLTLLTKSWLLLGSGLLLLVARQLLNACTSRSPQ